MTRIVVTGGAGFIGSHLVRALLAALPEAIVVNIDLLTYAGNLENLADLEGHPRYVFLYGDVATATTLRSILADGADAVVHCAAESHVDRSILDAAPFVRTNVLGTHWVLEGAREAGVPRVLIVSTDEVYGDCDAGGVWREDQPLDPHSPYAASKAAGDLLAAAYARTYGLPVLIARMSNVYGPYQFPEKFIPLAITNALEDRPIPVYGDGQQRRLWIYIDDVCRGLIRVLERGEVGEVYHLGGAREVTNLDLVRTILSRLGKSETLLRFVADRPGHDRRYALDSTKAARVLPWRPEIDLETGLEGTIAWYQRHTEWWQRVKSGAYREYYERQYAHR